MRPADLSGDFSSSEAALEHVLRETGVHSGIFSFPSMHLALDAAGRHRRHGAGADAWLRLGVHRDEAAQICVAANCRRCRARRPPKIVSADASTMRDEFEEVGAVYTMHVSGFLQAQHRFPGKTALHEIPVERSLEIDDELDFIMAEAMLRRRLQQDKAAALPLPVEALVMDFDGVFTDNGCLCPRRASNPSCATAATVGPSPGSGRKVCVYSSSPTKRTPSCARCESSVWNASSPRRSPRHACLAAAPPHRPGGYLLHRQRRARRRVYAVCRMRRDTRRRLRRSPVRGPHRPGHPGRVRLFAELAELFWLRGSSPAVTDTLRPGGTCPHVDRYLTVSSRFRSALLGGIVCEASVRRRRNRLQSPG